jgi:2-keto-4-pentenoate hydratase/2-oxohepta-3-ene-1,7-dioic acid hydratase in catechol pathway
MIFPIPVLISFISRQFTLEEGDLIVTGTPAGVSPIVPGDTVEVEIEKIGILSNPVV